MMRVCVYNPGTVTRSHRILYLLTRGVFTSAFARWYVKKYHNSSIKYHNSQYTPGPAERAHAPSRMLMRHHECSCWQDQESLETKRHTRTHDSVPSHGRLPQEDREHSHGQRFVAPSIPNIDLMRVWPRLTSTILTPRDKCFSCTV